MIDLLGVDQTAEIKQRGEVNTWRIFETQSVAEFGNQHPLRYCDLRSSGSFDDQNRRFHPSQMANNFYLDAIQGVATITDGRGVRIMSCTTMPHDTHGLPTCWKRAQTCAPSSFCSVMRIWR